MSTYIDCNVLNDIVFVITAIFTLTDYFKWLSSFKSNIVKNDSSLYWDKVINQAFLFNYCTLCINFSVFNDCLLILTVRFSMTLFLSKLCLDRLTISNENPVSNPILLRMTALFMKKAYKPSVSSFQLLYLVHWHRCFQWLSTYIDCNVLNDIVFVITAIFTLTDYFKWVSSFKSNIVKNDSSLYWDKVINQAFLFNYCTLGINFSVFNDCLLILTVRFSMTLFLS